MAEDIDIDEWEMYDALAKMNDSESLTVVRSKKTKLPKDAIKWRDIVGEFSLLIKPKDIHFNQYL